MQTKLDDISSSLLIEQQIEYILQFKFNLKKEQIKNLYI